MSILLWSQKHFLSPKKEQKRRRVTCQKKHLEKDNIFFAIYFQISAFFVQALIILGDGEFDGCDVQKFCADSCWRYVFRAGKNVIITQGDEEFQLKDMSLGGLPYLLFEDVEYTAQKYGKVNIGYFHQKGYKDPLCLVTNFELIEQAHQYYKKRFLIETFFSDIKSRGFNAQKSKLEDPERINTLLIPLCLSYIFTI